MNYNLCSGSLSDERDVLWWHGRTAASAPFLPQGVLQVICKNLQSTKGLLTARLICRDFRDAASMELNAVEVPQAALCRHRRGSSLAKVFPCIHTLGLSLKDVHRADRSSRVTCVASLATLLASNFGTSLQHLVLKDVPVLAHPRGSRWQLQPLQRLTSLKSLELRLVACLPRSCSASDAQLAQASLLSTLAPLQHLTSLTLCLLNLQAFPLHPQGHPSSEHPAQIEETEDAAEVEEAEDAAQIAGNEGRTQGDTTSPPLGGVRFSYDFSARSTASNGLPASVEDGPGCGFSADSAGSSRDPAFVEDSTDSSSVLALVEDGPDVDVDVEEAQHASHEAPDVVSLLPLAHGLRVLRLEQCVMRHRALDQLCRSLTNLEHLTLSGHLGLSQSAIRGLSGLAGLKSLSLGSVQLIFEEDEDCPETVMSALYGCLEGLPDFQCLSFTLATLDNTRWLHTAYTLGLYEHTGLASTLRALELNTVIFDCDYSLLIFAELTALTSLRMCYQTWPLSLGQEDLKLLAPLGQNLRELKLQAHPQEEHQLLALTNGVLETWRASFVHLTCLHFSGLILFKDSSASELARFPSLTDLSLTATADVAYQQDISYFLNQGPVARAYEPEECSKSASTRAALGEFGGGNNDNQIGELQRRQSFRHRAARGALHLGWSLGPRSLPDLHVPSSIPPTLSKLALSGFALCMRDYSYIASLPGLSHLQLSHPGLRPEHLLLTNTSSLTRTLEHLVLNSPAATFDIMQRHFDRRPVVPPWRLWCHQGDSEKRTSRSSTDTASSSFTMVTRKSSSTDSTASRGSSTSACDVGSRAELPNKSLVDQVPWWVDHEASLMALALAQLGQLQGLRHLQINVPCQTLFSKTTPENPSFIITKRQCTWSRESVVEALGDKVTQLRSLHIQQPRI